MSQLPEKVKLFHITAERNLPSIFNAKAILAKNELAKSGGAYSDIAYQGAQHKRARKKIAVAPFGFCHDYVPFYFAPRSPMLCAINSGNVEHCELRQEDIVHFLTSVDAIVLAELLYVFFDRNATFDTSTAYNDLKHLDKIDWELFFMGETLDGYSKWWNNVLEEPRLARRKETRLAEFLVQTKVPLTVFRGIGVYNKEVAVRVRELCKSSGIDLPVRAKPDWYF